MGAVEDVMLWRKEVSGELLAALVASSGLFYCVSGYMLLSFVSQVLMMLLTISVIRMIDQKCKLFYEMWCVILYSCASVDG
jgi:hypothetical protein